MRLRLGCDNRTGLNFNQTTGNLHVVGNRSLPTTYTKAQYINALAPFAGVV